MLPGFARKRHIFVEERMEQLERECSDFDINTIEYQDMDIGIITGGIAYQYVKEAMPQASVLKLGIVNPLPKDLITAFAKKVKQLYIVEELEPVIQEKVQSWGIACQGKELFTRHGEYSVNLIRHGILNEPLKEDITGDLMRRPPSFCPGCPHRAVFSLLKQMNYHVAGEAKIPSHVIFFPLSNPFGNSVFRDELVLLRRILLRTIPGHHVHIAISTVRPHRLASLFLNQIGISSNAVKLRDLVLFQCACTSFRYRNQIRLLTSKALASISAKPLADASTISLNFPSGKFSSCNRYSSFQGP